MKEIWKDIAGYEGLYQVSNCGNVRSLDRMCERKKYGNYFIKGKTLKPGIDRRGYFFVVLSKHSKLANKKVHRLVAQAFIENKEGLPQINHKDENKQNNKSNNLEWCTNIYNANYGTLPIRRSKSAKERIKNAKELGGIKRSQAVIMCDKAGAKIKEFSTITEAAKAIKNKDAVSAISKCCRNKRKTAYGFVWKYNDKR